MCDFTLPPIKIPIHCAIYPNTYFSMNHDTIKSNAAMNKRTHLKYCSMILSSNICRIKPVGKRRIKDVISVKKIVERIKGTVVLKIKEAVNYE